MTTKHSNSKSKSVVNDTTTTTATTTTNTNTTVLLVTDVQVQVTVTDKSLKIDDKEHRAESQSFVKNDTTVKQQQQQQQEKQQQPIPKLTLKSFFFPNPNEITTIKPLQKKKKTHFGKADPKRDLVVLVSICLFSYYLSLRSNTLQSGKKPIEEQLAEKLNTAIQALTKIALSKVDTIHTTIVHRNRRTELDNTCPIYTSFTSIPHHTSKVQYSNTTNNNNNNLGLFAGKEYNTGDIIFNISIEDVSKSSSSHAVLSFQYNTSTTIIIPSYSLLIKHHPSMYNINGNTIVLINNNNNNNNNNIDNNNDDNINNNLVIRATQTIYIGQELFFHPQQHLYTTIQPILSQIIQSTGSNQINDVQNEEKQQQQQNNYNVKNVQQQQQQQQQYVYQSLNSIFYTIQQTIPTHNIYTLADTIAHDISQSIVHQHGLLNIKKVTIPKVVKNPRQRIPKTVENQKKIDHLQQRNEQRLYYNQLQRIKADEHIYSLVIRSIQNLMNDNNINNIINLLDYRNNNNKQPSESNNNNYYYYQSLIPLLPINNQQYKEYYTEDIVLESEEAVASKNNNKNADNNPITVLSSSMYRSIKNNTIFDLYIHGTCMYDIIVDDTTTSATDATDKVRSIQLANRNNPVLKDTVLYNIPILVLPKIVQVLDNVNADVDMTCLAASNDDGNNDCSISDKSNSSTTIQSNSHHHCYHTDLSSISLCPLSIDNQYGPLWISIPSSLQTLVLTQGEQPKDQQHQQSSISNVEYQWMTTDLSKNNNQEHLQTISSIGSIIYLNVVSTTKIMNGEILYSTQSLQEVMKEYFVHTSSAAAS